MSQPDSEHGARSAAEAADLARLYDLDLSVDPGDLDLYLALAGRTGGPIVELCAGTGRLALPLAEAGFDITLVDIDPAMLARARTRIAEANVATAARMTIVEGDLFRAEIPGRGSYRLAIVGLNSILILGGPRRRRTLFTVLASLLAPGGVAVVDAWMPLAEDLNSFDGRLSLDWIRHDPSTGNDVMKLSAAWYDSTTRAVALTAIFDEGKPGQAPRRRIREDSLHLVAADELRTHAEDAGLEVEMIAGAYDLSPLQPNDERAIVVARLPDGP